MARIVLYDACALFPAPLRDLLVRLALTDLIQARWTDQIHDEWTRSVAAKRQDIDVASLDRCRRLMNNHIPDCLITGYEFIIPSLTLPDPDDRHVLAAAIHGRAKWIVTFNLMDFPTAILSPFEIEAVHPDEFIVRLWEESTPAVLETVRLQRAGLKKPPRSADQFLDTLEQCRLHGTVSRLRPHADQI